MRKLLLLLAMGIVLFGCVQSGGSNGQSAQNASGTDTQNVTGTNASVPSGTEGVGATVTVLIKNFAFNPADILIKKGDTVVWSNADAVSHSIKSASGSFDSPPISPGNTFQHTFSDESGTYNYSCGIHPSMKGSITING